MAYDEYMAERIRTFLDGKKLSVEEKKMMGGICFMVNGKMLCGTHTDKKRQCDLLMARIGPDAMEEIEDRSGWEAIDFTGRAMKGYVFVRPEGFDLDEDLEYWLQLCLNFNPLAKASKKKKKK